MSYLLKTCLICLLVSSCNLQDNQLLSSFSNSSVASEKRPVFNLNIPFNESPLKTAGEAGKQTPVTTNSQSNPMGYYEYLPIEFNENNFQQYPVIFYWNGKNTGTGNGTTDLPNMLKQGLPKNINEGMHLPAIVISTQIPGNNNNPAKYIDVHPFVEYILARYSNHIDRKRIYVTGFSMGGGVTIDYTNKHPDVVTAMVPISAATGHLSLPANPDLGWVDSWMFHNEGDQLINYSYTTRWHKAVSKYKNADHKLTLWDSDSHYAQIETYQHQPMWDWLLSKSK